MSTHVNALNFNFDFELEFERYPKELRPVSGIPQTVEEAAAQQEREDQDDGSPGCG